MTVARKRLAPEARRQHLMEAALHVFARKRYDETDLEEIASAAGVQRGLLYHYFPDGKEELHAAALERAWGELVGRLDVDPTRSAASKLPANLGGYLDLVAADDASVRVVRQARQVESPRARAVTRDASLALSRGMALNQLGTADPPAPVLTALLGFLGFFEVVLDEWLEGTITREQLERLVAAALPAVARASVPQRQ